MPLDTVLYWSYIQNSRAFLRINIRLAASGYLRDTGNASRVHEVSTRLTKSCCTALQFPQKLIPLVASWHLTGTDQRGTANLITESVVKVMREPVRLLTAKAALYNKIDAYARGRISHDKLAEAVDDYTRIAEYLAPVTRALNEDDTLLRCRTEL